MKVMKFEGTCIGRPEKMQHVGDLVIGSEEPTIVVLSALSGTTSALTEISNGLAENERNRSKNGIRKLEKNYRYFINDLLQTEEAKKQASKVIDEHFDFLNTILKISFSKVLHKDILAQGDLLSSAIFSVYLTEKGIPHAVLPALDFMQIDSDGEPLIGNIRVKLTQLINAQKKQKLFITQGYICRNHRAEVDNFRRGGSDYSASLIAAAINATVCEIWTDIDAMQHNDPALVKKTIPVAQLSFDEAAELAYFGAKILHPASIWPAQEFKIPVRLLNITQPDAKGTSITQHAGSVGVKAIVAKDGITAINIKSSRMLLAYGFLRKVFDVFEYYRTPIDMVTTSEVAVSVTIDNKERIEDVVRELEAYGTVDIDDDQTIISIVGNEIAETPQLLKRIFASVADMPVRMVTYGASRHNISLLIASAHKAAALQALNKALFE